MWGSLSTLECRRQVQRIMSVRQKAQTEGREGAAAALDVMLPMEVMTGVTPVESEPAGLPGDVLPWLFGLPFPFRGVGSSKVSNLTCSLRLSCKSCSWRGMPMSCSMGAARDGVEIDALSSSPSARRDMDGELFCD